MFPEGQRPGASRFLTRLNAPLLAAAAATLLCAGAYVGHRLGWFRIPLIDQAELSTIDARFRVRGTRAPRTDDIVIVGLDDETRARFPATFQKREGWATLIDALARYEPRAIGLDAFYSSPELSLPEAVVSQVREAYARVAGVAEPSPETVAAREALGAVIEATRGDEKLADAVGRAERVLLGVLFFTEHGEQRPADPNAPEKPGLRAARYPEAVVIAEAPPSARPQRAESFAYVSLPMIAERAAGAGFLNVMPSVQDASVRRAPAVIEHGGRYYMPMALAMALRGLQTDELAYVGGSTEVVLGDRALPVDSQGAVWLSFLGPSKTFPHVSAADVLAGTADPARLRDKLVFVGYTDLARDAYATPFDPLTPGVEIHATFAHNALHGELLRAASPLTAVLTILLLGVVVTVLQLRRVRQGHGWLLGAVLLVVLVGYLIYAYVAFVRSQLIIEVAAPTVAYVVITLAALVAAVATEGREKRRLRAAFSQYVADTIVDRILRDPTRARLGGVRRELTVLFSDIRGFSRFAEKLPPEVLSGFLNEYLTPMTELVMERGGMLDKYIGDAVMGVYGAPLEAADHAQRACGTALDMMRALGPLNEQWAARDLPRLAIGIGINSGAMSVGNMGSEARFDYTVIGDAVNLAARLEALTKEYKAAILVGERTRELAGDDFVFRELDWVRVKGREGTARIYELVGTPKHAQLSPEALAQFNDALEAYRAREWDEAEAGFAAFLADYPDDGPAQTFVRRIAALRAEPPDADWDGVYSQRAK